MSVVKYIADGFVNDVDQLFAEFTGRNDLEFAVFAEIWRKRSFSLIYMGRENMKELGEFTQEIFCLSAKFLLSDSLPIQVGATYLLYALYQNQISVPVIPIRILLPQFLALKSLLEKAVTEKLYSLHYVLDYLFENCFVMVANSILMGPNGRKVGDRSKRHCDTMDTEFKSNIIELKQSNLLGDLKNAFARYARVRPTQTWMEASSRFAQMVSIFDRFVTEEPDLSSTKSSKAKAGSSRMKSEKSQTSKRQPRSSFKSQVLKAKTALNNRWLAKAKPATAKRFAISYEESDCITPKLFLPRIVRTKTRRIRRYYKELPTKAKSESDDTSSTESDEELPSCSVETPQKSDSNVEKRLKYPVENYLKSNSRLKICSGNSQKRNSAIGKLCPSSTAQKSDSHDKISPIKVSQKPVSIDKMYSTKITQDPESDNVTLKHPFENYFESNSGTKICSWDLQKPDYAIDEIYPIEITQKSNSYDEISPLKVSPKPESEISQLNIFHQQKPDEITLKYPFENYFKSWDSQKRNSVTDKICPMEISQTNEFYDEISSFKVSQKPKIYSAEKLESGSINLKYPFEDYFKSKSQVNKISGDSQKRESTDEIDHDEISQKSNSLDKIYPIDDFQAPEFNNEMFSTEIPQTESFAMVSLKYPVENSPKSHSKVEMFTQDSQKQDSIDKTCPIEISQKRDSHDETSPIKVSQKPESEVISFDYPVENSQDCDSFAMTSFEDLAIDC